jgi:hypothetical protein
VNRFNGAKRTWCHVGCTLEDTPTYADQIDAGHDFSAMSAGPWIVLRNRSADFGSG